MLELLLASCYEFETSIMTTIHHKPLAFTGNLDPSFRSTKRPPARKMNTNANIRFNVGFFFFFDTNLFVSLVSWHFVLKKACDPHSPRLQSQES